MARHCLRLIAGLCLTWLATSSVFAQSLPVVVPQVDDPLLENLTIPANASTDGMWSPVMGWPLVSIHVALLPDGTVLTYGSPVGVGEQLGEVFDRWDPLTLTHATSQNAVGVNSFCSASILQQSGDLLVSGGNSPFASSLFDYGDGTATGEPSNLASERWYATLTMLSDGRSLITGGEIPYFTETWKDPQGNLGNVSMTPEVYTPGSGWSSLFGANSQDAFGPDHNRWWYPRQWVAPNGQVFGISSEKMWYLDAAGNGSVDIIGTFKSGVNNATRPNIGPTSTAVMYDVGKVLQMGGNGYNDGHATISSEFATIFDVTSGEPVITEASPMQHRRQWANVTAVPTGHVIVTGGTRFANNGGSDAVYQAEVWDPDTDTWDGLASAAVIRNYHSSTILLPNGTVFSSGGGVPGPVTNFNAEIFNPPYLFEDSGGGPDVLADAPRMISISGTQFDHGSDFQIEMADSRVVARVALSGLGSTTHSFDMGQRYYPAVFSQEGALLTVAAPPSPNLAPPGYYLLFAVDEAGVPSRGLIVALAAAAPGCAVDGDCDDGSPCTEDACSAGICSSTRVPCAGLLINADFENGAEGFAYSDDAFRGTQQPAYASGSTGGGALQVIVGGIDDDDIQGMSGGWTASFTLPVPAMVGFRFDYSLDMSTEYEADECSEVLVGVDGVLYGTAPDDFVDRLCDGGVIGGTFVGSTLQLAAGPHSITIGGFNNLKTFADEQTTFQIDDVLVTENPADPGESTPIAVTGHTPGVLELQYAPACNSTNHDVYYALLPPLPEGQIEWTGQICDIGVVGTHALPDPAPGSSYMFVVVGNREGIEGSYGKSSSGEERPAFVGAPCATRAQALEAPCE